MKKRLLALLGLTLLVGGGFIAYEHVLIGRLSETLQKQADTIAAGYQTLVEQELVPVTSTYELNEQQKRIHTRITETDAKLEKAGSLEEKIENISMLQVALVSFIKTVTPDQPFVKDEHFMALQQEMGERGDMRELLREYNDSALRWNNTVQSDVASLASQIGVEKKNLLPYLRFDGEQEFVTVVEL